MWRGTTLQSLGGAAVAAGQLAALGYSADEIRQRLCETAEDIGLPSSQQGCDLLDVAAALGLDSSDGL